MPTKVVIRSSAKRPRFTKQQIDCVIRNAEILKNTMERSIRQWDEFRRKALIPLARREGYKKGDAWLLQGFENSALIERVLDVFITDQAFVSRLTKKQIAHWLVAVYKPALTLKNLYRPGNKAIRPEHAVGTFRTFLKKAVQTRRHWRVARVSVRSASSASSAVKSSARRKAA